MINSSIIYKVEDNIIYVDFALFSMVKSVESWYESSYQHDYKNIIQKSHTFHLIRFYDRERFSNYESISRERQNYLEEVDLYVQMRRDE